MAKAKVYREGIIAVGHRHVQGYVISGVAETGNPNVTDVPFFSEGYGHYDEEIQLKIGMEFKAMYGTTNEALEHAAILNNRITLVRGTTCFPTGRATKYYEQGQYHFVVTQNVTLLVVFAPRQKPSVLSEILRRLRHARTSFVLLFLR